LHGLSNLYRFAGLKFSVSLVLFELDNATILNFLRWSTYNGSFKAWYAEMHLRF